MRGVRTNAIGRRRVSYFIIIIASRHLPKVLPPTRREAIQFPEKVIMKKEGEEDEIWSEIFV